MPDSQRRVYPFELQIAGLTVRGVVLASEAEVAELLARGLGAPPAPDVAAEPAPRGRPSLNSSIDAAVEQLAAELPHCETVRDAARLVQRQIARSGDPDSVPKLRTIERHLAERAKNGDKNQPVRDSGALEGADAQANTRDVERPRRRSGKP